MSICKIESLTVSFSCRHVDEVREFIKNVYVDEKYAVGTQVMFLDNDS